MFSLADALMLFFTTSIPFFVTLFEAFMEARRSFRHGLWPTLFFNVLLFGTSIIWWFIYAEEDFSQAVGAIVLGITFVFSCLIDFIILYLARKKKANL